MEAAIPPILFLGGHGSTHAARAAVEQSLRTALPNGVEVFSVGGPVGLAADASAWWSDEPEADGWPALVALLDSTADSLGLAARPIVVVGFSQGGAAALAWASTPGRRQTMAAVVCVAGFLPGSTVPVASGGAPAVVVVMPEDDELVDPFLGAVAVRALSKAGFPVTRLDVAGGHEWTPTIASAVARWLAELH